MQVFKKLLQATAVTRKKEQTLQHFKPQTKNKAAVIHYLRSFKFL